MKRQAKLSRKTRETDIQLRLALDGAGQAKIATGLPFFDHMLTALAKHGRLNLELKAKGDLEIDPHHTMEDVGLVLGAALKEALGTKAGIVRFGAASVPMDEALAEAVVDISGRPCLAYAAALPSAEVGGIPVRLFREFFQAVVNTSGLTLHLRLLAGEESHHCMEAMFKAFARALKAAAALDPAAQGEIPSTKGSLD